MAKKKKAQENNDSIFLEEITVEREIAEVQLERLRMASRDRMLTFEETKIFDLLTKNLLLSKGKATDIVGNAKRLPNNVSTDKLIEIAKQLPANINSLTEVDSDDNK